MRKPPTSPGDTYGRWTVLSVAPPFPRGKRRWLCRCSCGTERIVSAESLRRGTSVSCGCLRSEKNREMCLARNVPAVFIGERYGRLVVEAYAGMRTSQRAWLCRCDCGNTITVIGSSLRNGNTRSCGCIRVETNVARMTTHGGSHSPEHVLWKGMHQRCKNPNHIGYPHYGGRGIYVCERWSGPKGFANFLADMGSRPEGISKKRAKWTIERVDNDGPYSPENCRWATWPEQRRNQRRPMQPA